MYLYPPRASNVPRWRRTLGRKALSSPCPTTFTGVQYLVVLGISSSREIYCLHYWIYSIFITIYYRLVLYTSDYL